MSSIQRCTHPLAKNGKNGKRKGDPCGARVVSGTTRCPNHPIRENDNNASSKEVVYILPTQTKSNVQTTARVKSFDQTPQVESFVPKQPFEQIKWSRSSKSNSSISSAQRYAEFDKHQQIAARQPIGPIVANPQYEPFAVNGPIGQFGHNSSNEHRGQYEYNPFNAHFGLSEQNVSNASFKPYEQSVSNESYKPFENSPFNVSYERKEPNTLYPPSLWQSPMMSNSHILANSSIGPFEQNALLDQLIHSNQSIHSHRSVGSNQSVLSYQSIGSHQSILFDDSDNSNESIVSNKSILSNFSDDKFLADKLLLSTRYPPVADVSHHNGPPGSTAIRYDKSKFGNLKFVGQEEKPSESEKAVKQNYNPLLYPKNIETLKRDKLRPFDIIPGYAAERAKRTVKEVTQFVNPTAEKIDDESVEFTDSYFDAMDLNLNNTPTELLYNKHLSDDKYKKYYAVDFLRTYGLNQIILPDQTEQFSNDLRAIFYRIFRGFGYYYNVYKLSEEDPSYVQKFCNEKFSFAVVKNGEVIDIVKKDMDEIDLMTAQYGVKITYAKTAFLPQGLDSKVLTEGDYVNSFKGYKCKTVSKEELAENIHKLAPIFKLIKKAICQDCPKKYAWLINWIRRLLFKPEEKIGTYLLLLGEPGSGKSTFITWLVQHVIGGPHAAEINDLKKFFTRFNGISQNLILATFGEMPEMNEYKKISESIKSYVTDHMQALELKGIDTTLVKNYTNFIFASNSNIRALCLQRKDRRASVFPVGNLLIKDEKSFGEIYACFKDKDCADLFATYVKHYDIHINVSDHGTIPRSDKKEAIERCFQSSHYSFFDDVWNKKISLLEYVEELEKDYMKGGKEKAKRVPIVSRTKIGNCPYMKISAYYDLYLLYARDEHCGAVKKCVFENDGHPANVQHHISVMKQVGTSMIETRVQHLVCIPPECLQPSEEDEPNEMTEELKIYYRNKFMEDETSHMIEGHMVLTPEQKIDLKTKYINIKMDELKLLAPDQLIRTF